MTGDTLLRYNGEQIETKGSAPIVAYDEKKRKEECTTMFSMRLQNSTDADILEYLAQQMAQGKTRQGIIKQALREYMKNHPDPKPEYRYGMRLRGYSPGAQPKGVLRREDDTSGKYHDIIVYDRQLSAAEVASYELDKL